MVLAKMDATANDIPSPKITVRGYPTLFFITAKGDGALPAAAEAVGGLLGGWLCMRPRLGGGCWSSFLLRVRAVTYTG